MIKNFLSFIADNSLFTKENKLLVAVSGGIDSIVLCNLLLKCGYDFAIAHCNFHLRNEESNRDAEFVRQYAKKNGIKDFFSKDFDTFYYMEKEKKSLEMAAREQRYQWFEELLDEKKYDYLLTGHHGDDSAETIFINILRGTGIAGLHGILPKSNRICRPLLFASRKDIESYAKKNNIEHIYDSSNSSNKIIRNRIRNEVFPVFRDISPNFDSIIRREIERFRQTEMVFREVIDQIKGKIIEQEDLLTKISIAKLKELRPLKIFLFEIFAEYGFNEATINAIEESLFEEVSGKQFLSDKFRAIRDRQYIIINKINEAENKPDKYLISSDVTKMKEPLPLNMEILRDLKFISIPTDKKIAMVDFDLLEFPLILRKWEKGDSFIPFGSSKTKKLSDFFTNLKYSLWDKENQWLLCSGDNRIIWIVGKRLDERFKITEQTKTIYRIDAL
ncbi:MAG: tRNA lysidine(34) synthetase TilS [Bacteroidales bacterium]|jgi:tRNA(Ile)-lysidine synthase|nr:tRNA lysidine(34) synthetase TilS [Bacteroidales bacterium]